MKIRVLITGGSGLLALNWAISIRECFDVFLVMHSRKVNLAKTKSVFMDMKSKCSIERLFIEIQPDIVLHTAGLTNIECCEAHPDLAVDVNVNITKNLAYVCSSLGIKLVHISTDHLFKGDSSFVGEYATPSPLNVYGQTKATAEMCVLDLCPTALVIRTNFFGWGTAYRYSFSDLVIKSLRSNRIIRLFDDVYFCPIMIQDLQNCIHELLKHNATGIFNVVGNERISKYKFGLRLANKFDLDSNLIQAGSITDKHDLVLRPHDMSLSNLKVTNFLGRKISNLCEQFESLKMQEREGITKELEVL
jgi:dTDP-4-dehydrorhamnose reductase